MVWIDKVADFFSLSSRYVFIIAVITGAVLLLPQSVAEFLGINNWRPVYRAWIAVAAFIATFFFLATLLFNSLVWAYYRLNDKEHLQQEKALRQELLQQLTPEEAQYLLRNYIDRRSRTAYFDIYDAVIGGLVAKNILYPIPKFKNQPNERAFNIQSWAYKYVSEHPGLLKERE